MTKEEASFILANIDRRVCDDELSEALDMAINALEQEPKIGHWIIIDDCERFIAKCSQCGRIEDSRMISKYSFCHCGAKMEGE